jgi:uncharacterized YigZ family protein
MGGLCGCWALQRATFPHRQGSCRFGEGLGSRDQVWLHILFGKDAVVHYTIPAQETRVEIRVVNSRFIATVAPTFTVAEARAFVSRIRGEYADASHNVSAYVIGHGNTVVAHAHDDGEPSGTAGRPALAVLQGSGLGDIAVVVTRYFGGTKLGTGGLVRAYGDAVREILAVLPRAIRVSTHTVRVSLPYALYERVQMLIESRHGQIVERDFGAQVCVTVRFAAVHVSGFANALRELSNGTLEPEIVGSDDAAIVPLGELGIDSF